MPDRINRNDLYISIAKLIAKRGTCERLRVGAVVTKDNRIVATGYNGTPPGELHCDPSLCDKTKTCRVSIHAEANLIAFAARCGISLAGTRIYITHHPCRDCAELIIQAGITELIYAEMYGHEDNTELLRANGVRIWQHGE